MAGNGSRGGVGAGGKEVIEGIGDETDAGGHIAGVKVEGVGQGGETLCGRRQQMQRQVLQAARRMMTRVSQRGDMDD